MQSYIISPEPPNFRGLDDNEVAQTIQSAIKAERKRPFILNKVIEQLTEKNNASQEDDMDDNFSDEILDFTDSLLERMPPLSPALCSALQGVSRKFHMSIIVGLLPAFCSYAEKVTYRYADNRKRRPKMLSFIVAPPSSGKSVVTDKLNIVMDPMRKGDREMREKGTR